ncbi:hypothetical protein Acife_0885 [Acidithiobacillus ferrivorans SS3]|uniref:Uncharacterized protein n=1 Tax=Acidithiobacillus ferrivorans SS3 TaxID=743299 RepID=G0JMN7_9PROT|nr:hypothetical protein [Acidithiobacillus ferrivorans]AEM47066.1 hypothetical protein Acife_0885 [Acidithiobacillus ferrivorans SS3]
MGLDADALDQHDRLQEKVERIITQALQETAQRRLKTDCGHSKCYLFFSCLAVFRAVCITDFNSDLSFSAGTIPNDGAEYNP